MPHWLQSWLFDSILSRLVSLEVLIMGFAQEQAARLAALSAKVDELVASEAAQDVILVSIAADVTALKEQIAGADSPEDIAAAQAAATALEEKVAAAVTSSQAQTAAAQAIDDLVPPPAPPEPTP